jgi:hypothetical protein
MTIGRMRVACWISKTTNTHTECVILITFPLQQWLHERISMLRYTFIASPVFLKVLSTRSFLTAAQNQATRPLRVDKYYKLLFLRSVTVLISGLHFVAEAAFLKT